jgi:hypothetical protein
MLKSFTRFLVATFLLSSTSAFAGNSLNCDASELARIKQGDAGLASEFFVKQITLAQVKVMIASQAVELRVPGFLNVPGVLGLRGQYEAYGKMRDSIEAEQAKLLPCLEAARQMGR